MWVCARWMAAILISILLLFFLPIIMIMAMIMKAPLPSLASVVLGGPRLWNSLIEHHLLMSDLPKKDSSSQRPLAPGWAFLHQVGFGFLDPTGLLQFCQSSEIGMKIPLRTLWCLGVCGCVKWEEEAGSQEAPSPGYWRHHWVQVDGITVLVSADLLLTLLR